MELPQAAQHAAGNERALVLVLLAAMEQGRATWDYQSSSRPYFCRGKFYRGGQDQ